jgi:predicted nucleotidyltransferase
LRVERRDVPDAHITLYGLSDMQEELSSLLGRKVGLISKRGIERSRNYIRGKAILGSAEVVYATACSASAC